MQQLGYVSHVLYVACVGVLLLSMIKRQLAVCASADSSVRRTVCSPCATTGLGRDAQCLAKSGTCDCAELGAVSLDPGQVRQPAAGQWAVAAVRRAARQGGSQQLPAGTSAATAAASSKRLRTQWLLCLLERQQVPVRKNGRQMQSALDQGSP